MSTWQFRHHNAAVWFALDLWPICFMWSCARECTSHTNLADSWVIPLCRYQLLLKYVPRINLAPVVNFLTGEKLSHTFRVFWVFFLFVHCRDTCKFLSSVLAHVCFSDMWHIAQRTETVAQGLCNHYNPIIAPPAFKPGYNPSLYMLSPRFSYVCNMCFGCERWAWKTLFNVRGRSGGLCWWLWTLCCIITIGRIVVLFLSCGSLF